MRKFMLVGALAILGTALLASSASAFDHHFTVLAKTTSAHRSGNTFHFKDKLLDPNNRGVKVGRDHGRCTAKGHNHHAVKCRAVAHLNGKIGGFGDIRVHGDFDRHDNRLNVVGGSGEFDGVAGKMKLHGTANKRIDRLHFDLTR